ncbi:leucine-rich repeat domain-containing protein [Treponema putidum]|uniref:leucine-rich repeat domain-containing protein n=1 Tax=Treponema putidum TaxID=221027 RepID=UPI0021032F9A|nr:leucine-rich repeat domain-containing protein [Treponema putidum]UTY30359.1 leucine-rich repeat domain-containing protein [Treponema putidum]
MKQINLRRAVNLTALVLAAGLLIGLTGCKPKVDPKYNYKVEHLQQNIADDNYTLYETETLSGKADETTSAAAKPYAGFTAQGFSQAAIKADGSTVVQIKYDRKTITLKLNLDGGTTTTPLTDGEDSTKLLTGKFGAKIPELTNLKKDPLIFDGWEPELPSTFPALPAETYKALWATKYRITVKGDERTVISENILTIDQGKTWNDIKAEATGKVSLTTEWNNEDNNGDNNGDYGIYEWRLGDENGIKLVDTYPIDKHMTVYAVTNYTRFNIKGKALETVNDKGYNGSKPKGKIIIPEGITGIRTDQYDTGYDGAFYNCTGITSISLPASLTYIGRRAFCGCTGLQTINLPASLKSIGVGAFRDCTGLTSITLPATLKEIGREAFVDTNLESAVFEDPTGWRRYGYSGGYQDIVANDLRDPSKAAKYLCKYEGGYALFIWKKD